MECDGASHGLGDSGSDWVYVGPTENETNPNDMTTLGAKVSVTKTDDEPPAHGSDPTSQWEAQFHELLPKVRRFESNLLWFCVAADRSQGGRASEFVRNQCVKNIDGMEESFAAIEGYNDINPSAEPSGLWAVLDGPDVYSGLYKTLHDVIEDTTRAFGDSVGQIDNGKMCSSIALCKKAFKEARDTLMTQPVQDASTLPRLGS